MDATAEPEAPEAPKTKTDAQTPTTELFKFSAWVHIGGGAETCERGEMGDCDDPRHFHAWCRLPNQFQHQDIRERGLAAKARRARQLRDPNTDAYDVLEADMVALERADDEALIEELLSKDWWKRYLEAVAEVTEREEYEHIDKDRERHAELRAMPEAERPADEFEELERHVTAYNDTVDEERRKLEEPEREGLTGLSKGALIEQIRDERINAESSAAFMDTYSKWQWVAGTYTTSDPIARKPVFTGVDELVQAAPEIIETLRATYAGLEASLQRGVQGN